MFERLRRKQDDVGNRLRQPHHRSGAVPRNLLFLQGEIGQLPSLPQNHYKAITLRPSLSGAIYAYPCLSHTRRARCTWSPRRSFARPYAITLFRSQSTMYSGHPGRAVTRISRPANDAAPRPELICSLGRSCVFLCFLEHCLSGFFL
jgi:hypothetical protein